MKKQFTIYDNEDTIEYEDTAATRKAVLDRILKYCKKYNCSCGEMLMQDDDCQIYASDVLADIIDNILEFKFVSKETSK